MVERNVARKTSTAFPKPAAANINDICECFDKIETGNWPCPKFLAGSYLSFPPQGFEYISPLICSLRDETSALRTEVAEIRQNNDRDSRALNNTNIVAQDVMEVKTLVQQLVANENDLQPASTTSGNISPQEDSSSSAGINREDQPNTESSQNDANEGNGNELEVNDGHGPWMNASNSRRNRPYSNALRNPLQTAWLNDACLTEETMLKTPPKISAQYTATTNELKRL